MTREQQRERGDVEHALGHDRPEDLTAPRPRPVAHHQDAQDLAAARRQHRVAHVADDRDADGVGGLVLDRGVPQDHVPAPAAGERLDRVDDDGRADERPPAGVAREGRRLLLEGPADDAGQGDEGDEDADRTLGVPSLAR